MEQSSGSKFHIYSFNELNDRVTELRLEEFLIEKFIPRQSISFVVGKSGEGKSPFLYQAMISVAAGIPLAGRQVKQGKVLYMDCENGLDQVKNLVSRISEHLGLKEPPPNLRLWNLNDAGEKFGQSGYDLAAFVAEERPDWVIIDPLKTIFPKIDQDNSLANECFRRLRKLGADFNCAFTGLHHPKKPSNKPDERPERLEITDDLRGWFDQSRGSLELINGSDVRIGLESSLTPGADIVVRGFGRVTGEFPMMPLARVNGSDGKPVGYRLLEGEDQLSEEQLTAFHNMPESFQFKQAREIYGKTDSPTIRFLEKLIRLGLLERPSRGLYRKIPVSGFPGESVIPISPLIEFEAA
jgi:hypothetical protein